MKKEYMSVDLFIWTLIVLFLFFFSMAMWEQHRITKLESKVELLENNNLSYEEVPACMRLNGTIYCPEGFVNLGQITIDSKISEALEAALTNMTKLDEQIMGDRLNYALSGIGEDK